MAICIIENCNKNYYAFGLCRNHYDQKRNDRGIFRTSLKRKMGDPNKFTFKGDICYITIHDMKGKVKTKTLINKEDYEKCSGYTWSSHTDRHGNIRIYNWKIGPLHTFLLGYTPSKNFVGDHINGDTLDNRRLNLQICTNQQNTTKRKKINKNNTSGFRGVTWHSKNKKWIAQIVFNNKYQNIGSYKKKEDAALAYNIKAKEIFGKFAILNKV